MSAKTNELRAKRGALHAEAMKLIPVDGSMTPEIRTKFDAMMADVDVMQGDIERVEKAERIDADLRSTQRPPEAAIGEPEGRTKEDWKAKSKRYRDAYWNSMRRASAPGDILNSKGLEVVSAEDRKILSDKEFRAAGLASRYREYRDMGIGSPTASLPTSVLVPQGFVYDLEVALKYYGDMLNVSTIMETATGNPLPYPTQNDTSTVGEIVGESQQVTGATVGQSVDLSVSNILLGAYKYSTKMVHVSLELLQDTAFDLEGYIKEAFAIRLGRILNKHFTVGGGTTQPYGIITQATSSGQTVLGDTNQTSPDPTQQVGYVDLVNLIHSVDPLYRRGAKFMFHDQTLRYFRTLLDKYGRPLWTPGMVSDAPDQVCGYPYSINNDMQQLTETSPVTNRETVAFGRLDKYLVRRVKDLAVLRLVERFADYGQVAFIGFARYDGNLLDAGTNPVKYLINPS